MSKTLMLLNNIIRVKIFKQWSKKPKGRKKLE